MESSKKITRASSNSSITCHQQQEQKLWWMLTAGGYFLTANCTVTIPNGLIADFEAIGNIRAQH
jgi:hypothetical protein